MIAPLLQSTPVVPADWLQFGALGLLALVLIGVGIAVFIIIRDVAKVIITRVAETGQFSEELARESLKRTQDIAEQSVAATQQSVAAQVQLAGAIKESTNIIEQLQKAILDTGQRHSEEHQEIKQEVSRLDGKLGRNRSIS